MKEEQLIKLYNICHFRSRYFYINKFLQEDLATETFLKIVKDITNKKYKIEEGKEASFVYNHMFWVYTKTNQKKNGRVHEGAVDYKSTEFLHLHETMDFLTEEDPLLMEKVFSYMTRHKTFNDIDVDVFYRKVKGMSSKKIGQEFNTTENAVNDRMFTIKKKLKTNVKKIMKLNINTQSVNIINLHKRGMDTPTIVDYLNTNRQNVNRVKRQFRLC